MSAEQDKLDALRWRALMSSDRIRVMGGAGFDWKVPGTPEPTGDYMHLGVELWSRHTAKDDPQYPQTRCRNLLTRYVDELIKINQIK